MAQAVALPWFALPPSLTSPLAALRASSSCPTATDEGGEDGIGHCSGPGCVVAANGRRYVLTNNPTNIANPSGRYWVWINDQLYWYDPWTGYLYGPYIPLTGTQWQALQDIRPDCGFVASGRVTAADNQYVCCHTLCYALADLLAPYTMASTIPGLTLMSCEDDCCRHIGDFVGKGDLGGLINHVLGCLKWEWLKSLLADILQQYLLG